MHPLRTAILALAALTPAFALAASGVPVIVRNAATDPANVNVANRHPIPVVVSNPTSPQAAVTVANTTPIPVQGTVSVASSTQAPLNVRVVNPPPEPTPFQTLVFATISPGGVAEDCAPLTIPAGTVLIVQQVAFDIRSNAARPEVYLRAVLESGSHNNHRVRPTNLTKVEGDADDWSTWTAQLTGPFLANPGFSIYICAGLSRNATTELSALVTGTTVPP